MKLTIIGDGAFGSFLKELLAPHFELVSNADSIILAVPLAAYDEVATQHENKHLINVCSVQKTSTDICLKHSERVTSIHPLFGRRTPEAFRHSIVSFCSSRSIIDNDTWFSQVNAGNEFINIFTKVSKIYLKWNDKFFTPELHDLLMRKTHVEAILAAKRMKMEVERANDIPDELLPHSFRMMKAFVKTAFDDMPKGTLDSIMANPFL